MSNPVSIIAKDKDEFKKKIEEYAKTDDPEGTHYFHISAKFLWELIKEKWKKF